MYGFLMTHRIGSMRIVAAILLVVVVLPTIVGGSEPPATGKQTPKLYDPEINAEKQISQAVAQAKRDHKRVLLMFGFNQCVWCHRLHGLFESDKTIARTLLYEYELVMIDNGRKDGRVNNAIVNARYGDPAHKNGWPFLAVLDEDGKAITKQETGSLEEGDHHDPAKVLAFLKKWQASPVSAQEALSKTMAQAKRQSKKPFVYFSAPWCGWCHKLDDYLQRPEIAKVFNQAFVPLKIDVDRMTGGKEMDAGYRGEKRGGIPFFVILDANGSKLADAIGEKGNVGFPALPHEIKHFINVIRKTAPNLSEAQLAVLEKGLLPEKPSDQRAGYSPLIGK